MKQVLTFPIVEDLLTSEKLILIYTLAILFIPSFCKHLLSTQLRIARPSEKSEEKRQSDQFLL